MFTLLIFGIFPGFLQLLDALAACCISARIPDSTRTWALNHLVISLSVHSAAVQPSTTADDGQGLPVSHGKEVRAHDGNITGCTWHKRKKLLATV